MRQRKKTSSSAFVNCSRAKIISFQRYCSDLPEQFVNDCAWSNAVHACDGGESGHAAKAIVEMFGGMVPASAFFFSRLDSSWDV